MVPSINPGKTTEFVTDVKYRSSHGISISDAPWLAERMGAVVDGSSTRFLIWHPEITRGIRVLLHLYVPDPNLVYDKPDQHCSTIYYCFDMESVGELAAIVIDHLVAGDKDQFGTFYEFEILLEDGKSRIVRDPMAWSMPYGIHAPAEVYNIRKVLASRKDQEYFEKQISTAVTDEENRFSASTNLLELHIGTATKEGTLASLTRRYNQIATALQENRQLQPEEQNLLGFDAVELMPIAPVVQHPQKHQFWRSIQKPEVSGGELTVHLRKPELINWGYDTPIFGSAAIDPSFLSTGRPHELLDFIEAMHLFYDRPIKVVLDVVYGHAHPQGQEVLPAEFIAGPAMYGKNIDFKHPVVRAMILEMHRRKMSWGFDGIRVDTAQDFRYYDSEQDVSLPDNDILKELSEVGVTIKGSVYKPWVILDDGRTWPGSDWELAASHSEILKKLRHSHQWSPALFGLNIPYRYTFWLDRWWVIKEHVRYGSRWISGYANHDTVRRGTQTNPKSVDVNVLLGNSLKMVMDNAYNNPSTTLLVNAFLPGVPMDFLQSLGNSPWSFFRNIDPADTLKIVAGESFFAEWQMTDIEYRQSKFFKRLKNLGFENLPHLQKFMRRLHSFANAAEWDPELTIALLNRAEGSEGAFNWDENSVEHFVSAWMNDVFEYCNTSQHVDLLNAKKTSFNLSVRNYRLENPWLSDNFKETDFLKYREPVDGTVIYYGYRKCEEARKEIIFLANMEGQPRQVNPAQFDFPSFNPSGWQKVLSTPSVRVRKIDQSVRLSISQGVLFEKVL